MKTMDISTFNMWWMVRIEINISAGVRGFSTVSVESLHILKEFLLPLNLGRRPLKMWVFVANITDELILGLDILRAYDK
jgi:hypothetical protein